MKTVTQETKKKSTFSQVASNLQSENSCSTKRLDTTKT